MLEQAEGTIRKVESALSWVVRFCPMVTAIPVDVKTAWLPVAMTGPTQSAWA